MTSFTEQLDALRTEQAELHQTYRALEREVDAHQRAIPGLREQLLQLEAADAAGRDVKADLKQVRKDLALYEERSSEPWRRKLEIAKRTAAMKAEDAAYFAQQHKRELWEERALPARAQQTAVIEALRHADTALRGLEGFASDSDQLCRLTGGNPREDMPLVELQGIRRAIKDFLNAGVPLPVPRERVQAPRLAHPVTVNEPVQVVGEVA